MAKAHVITSERYAEFTRTHDVVATLRGFIACCRQGAAQRQDLTLRWRSFCLDYCFGGWPVRPDVDMRCVQPHTAHHLRGTLARYLDWITENRSFTVKRLLCALAVTTVGIAVPATAADVGVSVRVGEPGFYGRIDIGNFPRPRVIYSQPVVIHAVPMGQMVREPIYLHVPPGHAKHWRKHCREYNACGQPVYFVQDRWYEEEYVPHYRDRGGSGHGERYRDDRGERHEHGNGHRHGKGHKDD